MKSSQSQIDPISIKINKIILVIFMVSISTGVLYLLSFFILKDIDQLISPLILLGIAASGVIAGTTIKETISGKIFYGFITALLAILPILIAIVLPSVFFISLSF